MTTYRYYDSSTDTEFPGQPHGYLEGVSIREGELGDAIPQSHQEFTSRTVGDVTTYLVDRSRMYSDDEGADEQDTTYVYGYFTGKLQVESVQTTDPAGGVTKVFNDLFGRPTWTKDEASYIHYTEYDQRTGAVTKSITDVNTTLVSNEPSGWTTPTGGGLHLVTSYEVDSLGRTIKMTDANGNVTYTRYSDVDHEVRVYPGWNTSTNKPTGPTIVTREDRANGNGYTETLTMSANPALDLVTNLPTGSEPISSVQSLSRNYYNAAGQVSHSDDYFAFPASPNDYSTSLTFGTQNTHFYRTEFS